MKNIIFLGPPGSGKGTIATELSPKLKIKHISTGDLLREVVASGSDLGLEIKSYMDKGDLVPDELVGKMIKEVLVSKEAEKGILLDGFPRTVNQAEMLNTIMAVVKKKIDAVFYLKVDLPVIIKRLSNRVTCKICGKPYHLINLPPKKPGICDRCGGELVRRDDDREETVSKRYETYIAKTEQLINYYKNKNLLIEIDGNQEKEITVKMVLSHIKS